MNTSIADEVLEQLKGMPEELQKRVLQSPEGRGSHPQQLVSILDVSFGQELAPAAS